MKLLHKQIKAVQEAKNNCINEALKLFTHFWDVDECSLCKVFRDGLSCTKCPFRIWEENLTCGCSMISSYIWEVFNYANAQDLACFLYSLELYLKDQIK